MPFGSERSLIAPQPLLALYYRLYGAARVGDKIRAAHVLPSLYAHLHPDACILDAGCSMGFYSLRIVRRFPAATVHAVDLDEAHLQALRTMAGRIGLDNLAVQQCDLTQLDFDSRFDCVLCVDVLEHIVQDAEVVGRLSRSLKPGGMAIVHVPQRDQHHYLPQADDFHAWDHVRAGYSLPGLSALLNQAGLQLIEQRNTFGRFGALASDLDEYFRRLKPMWTVLLPFILLLARLDTRVVNRWGNGLLVIARKP